MATLDQDTATCSVFTYKEGLLSPVAHDLKLRVGRWSMEIDRGQGGLTVAAAFDASSLTVEGVMKDGRVQAGVLSTRDTDKIAHNIRDEVLSARRHPSIGFRGTATPDGSQGRVTGDVTICGKTRPVTCRTKKVTGSEAVWVIEVTIHQPDFGIKPYSAMLGALKIKPDVVVAIEVADRVLAPLIA